jgi:phospho-N-acetylmuramoyl-pentapeptide-transferase
VGYWIYVVKDQHILWLPYILRFEFVRDFFTFFGFKISPSLNSIDIGWLIVPLIALIIMTVSNAVNISDGMDGLAGGLLLIAFTAYGIIAFGIAQSGLLKGNDELYEFRSIAYLCATSAGAILAYLYFNVKPARVQMGDVGSLAIGTLLSIIAVVLYRELTLLFIAGVFVFNGVISRLIQTIWLKITGKKLFLMIPFHYHLKKIGWTEEKIVMRFWIIGALLTAIGVYIAGL